MRQQNDDVIQNLQETGREPVNPFAIGGGFLDYCISQGWLFRQGKAKSAKYFVTVESKKQLSYFGINLE